MKLRPFRQVDVFTDRPYQGNPLAVVLDGTGLSDAEMQHFAHWTHLSETVFLLPPSHPQADYALRIFTPGVELPFAGHPTLGACHAWLRAGGRPRHPERIVQQCRVGLVEIRRQAAPALAFAAPPMRRADPDPGLLAQVLQALGLPPQAVRAAQVLDNGPAWLSILIDRADTLLALEPDHARLKRLGRKIGVVHVADGALHAACDAAHPQVLVRGFVAPIGVDEDPVTGSLNAALAQWLIADGIAPPAYVAAQGQRLGRNGRVHIERGADQRIWVGGDCADCIDGQIML